MDRITMQVYTFHTQLRRAMDSDDSGENDYDDVVFLSDEETPKSQTLPPPAPPARPTIQTGTLPGAHSDSCCCFIHRA